MLYPLKFEPILKRPIWGGNKLKELFGKGPDSEEPIGESWELSGLPGHESLVVNGLLAGNTINELLEIYMDELVGAKVFEQFGNEFPLLFKFIASSDTLSIQVHPNDEMAAAHNAMGKTEMWFVIDAEEGSELILGFNKQMDKESCLAHIENNTLETVLNKVKVKKGDVFYIPAGMVHAIGKGILLAEVQQASDITYRLYDYGRVDNNGQARELHIEEALEAINFDDTFDAKVGYQEKNNTPIPLVSCDYFTVNLYQLDNPLIKDLSEIDSFVVYMCLDGACTIKWDAGELPLCKGETVLVPAEMREVELFDIDKSLLMEVFVK